MEIKRDEAVVYQDPDKPPLEAPYLLSTMRSIISQRDRVRKIATAWNEAYPSWKGDHAAKVRWIRNIEKQNAGGNKAVEGGSVFDERDIIKEILSRSCCKPINVQLVVLKEKLAEFNIKAQSKSSIYERDIPAHNPPTAAPAPILPSMELFVVASEKVGPIARMDMVVPRLLMRLGLPIDAEVVPALPQVGRGDVPNFSKEWPEFAQEGIHFPINGKSESAIAFEIVSLKHSLSAYERECREIAISYPDENPDFILVAKNPEHNNLVPSKSTHDVLWYSLRIEFEHCKHHIRSGIGEIDVLRWELKEKKNDNTYNLRLEIFAAEISYIRRIPGRQRIQRKLSRSLALTLELKNEPEIIAGCTKPQLAEKCIADVAELWRVHLLKADLHSNASLGLAPTGNPLDGMESRKALFALLESVEKELVKIQTNTPLSKKITFNWRPAPSLKRPAGDPLVQNGASVPGGTLQPNQKIQRTSSSTENGTGIAKSSKFNASPDVHSVARSTNIANTSVLPVAEPPKPGVHLTAATPLAPVTAPVIPTGSPTAAAGIPMPIPAPGVHLPTTAPLEIIPTAAPAVLQAAVPNATINTTTDSGAQFPPGEKGGLMGGSSTGTSIGKNIPSISPSAAPVFVGEVMRSPAATLLEVNARMSTAPAMNADPVRVQSVGVASIGERSIGSLVNPMHVSKVALRQSPKGPKQFDPANIDGHSPVLPKGLVRPAGRAPHDKNGARMEWLSEKGIWASNTSSETRAPNLQRRTPKSPDLSKSGARPVGRAPNDSHGEPMNWSPSLNAWISMKNPEEKKFPKHKLDETLGSAPMMKSMMLPPSNQFINYNRISHVQETPPRAPVGWVLARDSGIATKGNTPEAKAFGLVPNPAMQQRQLLQNGASTANNSTVLRNTPAFSIPSNTAPPVVRPPPATKTPAVPKQQLSQAVLNALDAAIQRSDPATSQLSLPQTTVTQSEPENTTAHLSQITAVVTEALNDNTNNEPAALSHASMQVPADSKAAQPGDIAVPSAVEQWGASLDADLVKTNVDGNIDALFGGGVIPTRRL